MKKSLQIKKLHQLAGHNAAVFALGNGSSGHFLSGAGDGWLVQWTIDEPDPGRLLAKVDSNVFALCWLGGAPQDDRLVVGNMYGGVHWVNLQNPDQTKNILHHRKGVFAVRHINDHIYTIGGDGVLSKWSIPEQRAVESYALSNQSLRALDYSATRNEIAVGSSDQGIYLLDADNLQLKQHLAKAHNNSVFALRYHPNGRYLVSGGRDALLNVWDVEKQLSLVSSQAAHMYTINDVAFHPKRPIFATASRDRTIKFWDADSFDLLKVVETLRDNGHVASVNTLLWTPEEVLISGSDDRSIGMWAVDLLT
ncbi:MAG: hypothetical protein AAFO94_00715 [Bacteroidota bacterium]